MPSVARHDSPGQFPVEVSFDRRSYSRYTLVMLIEISIPENLFAIAEEAAHRLGISHSELFANALREYLAVRQSGDVTERLNAVYVEEESGLDPPLGHLQMRSVSSM
ncbi:MAG: hypothetical protein U0768_21470 [Anaerolineae bacterium]